MTGNFLTEAKPLDPTLRMASKELIRNRTVHSRVEEHVDHVKSRGGSKKLSAIYAPLSARDLYFATPHLIKYIQFWVLHGMEIAIWIPDYPDHLNLWLSPELKWFHRISGKPSECDTVYIPADVDVEDGAYLRLAEAYGERMTVLDSKVIGDSGIGHSYSIKINGVSSGNLTLNESLGFSFLTADPWVYAASTALSRIGSGKCLFLYPNITSSSVLNAREWKEIAIGLWSEARMPVIVPDVPEIDRSLLEELRKFACLLPVRNVYQVMERLWSSVAYVGGDSLYAQLAVTGGSPCVNILDKLPIDQKSSDLISLAMMPYRHSLVSTGKDIHYYGLETFLSREVYTPSSFVNSPNEPVLVSRERFRDNFSVATFISQVLERLRDADIGG